MSGPVLLEDVIDIGSFSPSTKQNTDLYVEAMRIYKILGDMRATAIHLGLNQEVLERRVLRGKNPLAALVILRELIDSYPNCVYLERLSLQLYPDPDDSPLDPYGTIRVFLSKLRTDLKPGWRIKSRYDRGVYLYHDNTEETPQCPFVQ